jgi:hypothetical protein
MSSNGSMKSIGNNIFIRSIIVMSILLCRYASENVNKLLVGNKNDLTSQRAVSFEQGKVSLKFTPTTSQTLPLIINLFSCENYYFLTTLTYYYKRNSLILSVSPSSRHPPRAPPMSRKPSCSWRGRSNLVSSRNQLPVMPRMCSCKVASQSPRMASPEVVASTSEVVLIGPTPRGSCFF